MASLHLRSMLAVLAVLALQVGDAATGLADVLHDVGEPSYRELSYQCSETCPLRRGQANIAEYRCKTGRCISIRGYCNGFPNCADNSDEAECPKNRSPAGDASVTATRQQTATTSLFVRTEAAPPATPTSHRTFGSEQGTTSTPYDCDAVEWSLATRVWCCKHRGHGCPTTTTTTTVASPPPAAASAPFNCDAGYADWAAEWSISKRVWCCKYEHRGCPTTAQATTETTWTTTSTGTTPTTSTTSTKTSTLTSTTTTTSTTLTTTITVTLTKTKTLTMTATTTTRTRTTTVTATTRTSTTTTRTSTTTTRTTTTRTTTTATTTTTSTTTVTVTTLPYDCDSGYSSWEEVWSLHKKVWCCQHQGVGCPEAQLPHDCHAGSSDGGEGWSYGKREWCCTHMDLGCTATSAAEPPPYDCAAGPTNLQARWSAGQSSWCCAHEGRGCPTMTTPVPYDCTAGSAGARGAWSEAQRRWCRGKMGPATTVEPFNCSAGACETWTKAKRAWCRQQKGSACAAAPDDNYDCHDGDFKFWNAWSSGKRFWCCKHRGRGCRPAPRSSGPYTCSGAEHSTWSDRRREWCCRHKRAGCPESARAGGGYSRLFADAPQPGTELKRRLAAGMPPVAAVIAGSSVVLALAVRAAWRRSCRRLRAPRAGYAEIPSRPPRCGYDDFLLAE